MYAKMKCPWCQSFRASCGRGQTPPSRTHPLVGPTTLQILATPLLRAVTYLCRLWQKKTVALLHLGWSTASLIMFSSTTERRGRGGRVLERDRLRTHASALLPVRFSHAFLVIQQSGFNTCPTFTVKLLDLVIIFSIRILFLHLGCGY